MKKQCLVAGTAAAIVLAPFRADAYEIIGKGLQVYGKANISAEYQDSETGRRMAGTRGPTLSGAEFAFSSNASRLGVKGVIPLDPSMPISVLYQIEQEINVDRDGETFSSRNSFFGLGTQAGDILFGLYDTAFKIIGADFTIWGDTAADRRTILGASPFNGNRMNVRAKNLLMYRFETDRALFILQYGLDQPDIENNHTFSAGGEFTFGMVRIGAAFERGRFDPAFGSRGGNIWGVRAGTAVHLDPVKLSLIFEHIDPEDGVATNATGRPNGAMGTLGRNAFGGSILYNLNAQIALGGQVLHAMEVSGARNTAATNYSLGAWYDITDWAAVYLIGSLTLNQSNARYAVADGGHGDRISTDFGDDPRILSAGFVLQW